ERDRAAGREGPAGHPDGEGEGDRQGDQGPEDEGAGLDPGRPGADRREVERRPAIRNGAPARPRFRRAAAVHELPMTASPLQDVRLKRAYDLISDKLARVEEELLLHFRSPIPTIDRIGAYLAQGGGKRIRPALLLLSARLLDYRGEKDVRYAAV